MQEIVFYWTQRCETAFMNIRKAVDDYSLAPFNPDFPIIANASPLRVATKLSHTINNENLVISRGLRIRTRLK